jgi:SAM-dependent methyltransferase
VAPPEAPELEAAEQLSAQPEPGSRQVGTCPACDSPLGRLLFTAGDRRWATTDRMFQIVECSECRLIRLFPQPEPEELRSYYPPDYWRPSDQNFSSRQFPGRHFPGRAICDWLRREYRKLGFADDLRFLERALRESAEQGIILDVGCGDGFLLSILSARGHGPAVGLDFSLDAARAAWRNQRVAAICGTLSSAPFADGSCAAISMFHVLQHLYNPVSFLDAAYRLLAPDGRLILQVPNAACWQFLLFGDKWQGMDVPRQLLHFRASDLETLLEHCGFEILRRKHFSLRDNPESLASSILLALGPIVGRWRRRTASPDVSRRWRLVWDFAHLALVVACVPFTMFEAACGAGSTVMVEARKKS